MEGLGYYLSLSQAKIPLLRNSDRQNRFHDRFYEHMGESLKHQLMPRRGGEGSGYSSARLLTGGSAAPLPQIAGLAAAHLPPIA